MAPLKMTGRHSVPNKVVTNTGQQDGNEPLGMERLAAADATMFRNMTLKLLSVYQHERPDVCAAVVSLARKIHDPNRHDYARMIDVVGYLRRTPGAIVRPNEMVKPKPRHIHIWASATWWTDGTYGMSAPAEHWLKEPDPVLGVWEDMPALIWDDVAAVLPTSSDIDATFIEEPGGRTKPPGTTIKEPGERIIMDGHPSDVFTRPLDPERFDGSKDQILHYSESGLSQDPVLGHRSVLESMESGIGRMTDDGGREGEGSELEKAKQAQGANMATPGVNGADIVTRDLGFAGSIMKG